MHIIAVNPSLTVILVPQKLAAVVIIITTPAKKAASTGLSSTSKKALEYATTEIAIPTFAIIRAIAYVKFAIKLPDLPKAYSAYPPSPPLFLL